MIIYKITSGSAAMDIFITVLFISFFKLSCGDLCEVCFCSGASIDCDTRVNISDTNKLKLLTSEIPQEIIVSYDNSSTVQVSIHKNTLQQFKILNLANNFLNESTLNAFSSLDNLKELNLSSNNWRILSPDVFKYFSLLSKLDLSHNFIAEIRINACNLTHLDLSYNQIVILSNGQLNCPRLTFINLSFNSITTIDAHAFANLILIDTLLLNNNFIQSLNVNFPFIKKLSVAHNKLFELPANLSVEFLNISYNFISVVQSSLTTDRLEFLDISKNSLNLINASFANLKTLNISYNNFSFIPAVSYKNLPALEEFIITGNPLSKLIFVREIKLNKFVASDLNLLESIDENSFDLLRNREGSCLNLTISFNKKLKFLHNNWLKKNFICYLDLSYNGLERITRQSIKTSNELIPKYGINLQGNPMICDCESQWMLDDLLPKLYTINSALLTNLRCNKPTEVLNVRMVHWYKWKTKVLCKSSIKFERLVTLDDNTYAVAQISSMIIIKSSNSAKFIIIGAATVLSLITIIGLVLSEKLARKHRRRNRRL